MAVQAGDYEIAVDRADEAVKRSPGDAGPLLTRAMAHYGACDYPKAAADAKAALKVSPKEPVADAIVRLSRRPAGCGSVAGKPADLERERLSDLARLTAPVETDAEGESPAPSPGAPRYTRETFLAFKERLERAERRQREKDFRGAFEDATWALVEYPENPRALLVRVDAAIGLEDYRQAELDASRGLRLRPEAWQFLGARAMARNEGGRPGEALSDALRALELKPDYAEARLVAAMARERLGAPAQSYLEDYKKAAELNPAYQSVYEAALARAREIAAAGAAKPKRARPWGPIAGGLGAAGFVGLLMAFYFLGGSREAGAVVVIPGTVPEAARAPAVGSYEVGHLIGSGGMGNVYEGIDRNLDRKVAIKELRPELREDERAREQFLDEARLVAALSHPNIVAIHALVKEPRRVLLIFEHIEGKTLQRLIDESPKRRLAPREALELAKQACAALEYAHGRRVIHRDLKPSNIMRTEGGTFKVMDFGIARRAKDSLRGQTATAAGTPYYMAPESEAGRFGPESDLYSLGVTLYEALTGELPFADDLHGAKREGRFEPVSGKLRGAPASLDDFFRAALSPDPGQRPRSAAAFAAAFEKALKG